MSGAEQMNGARLPRRRGLGRDTSGTSLIEFAVLLPVFVTLVFGMIDLGRLFWVQTAMQHGAEMAARCATINTTTCGTANQIQTYAGTQAYGLTLPTNTFTATTPTCGNQVIGSYTFSFLASFNGTSMTLSAKSCYPR